MIRSNVSDTNAGSRSVYAAEAKYQMSSHITANRMMAGEMVIKATAKHSMLNGSVIMAIISWTISMCTPATKRATAATVLSAVVAIAVAMASRQWAVAVMADIVDAEKNMRVKRKKREKQKSLIFYVA